MGIVDWKEGEEVEGEVWLVSGVEKTTQKGSPYWEGTLRDVTGFIGAKLWDGQRGQSGQVERHREVLGRPGPVRVRGKLSEYRGKVELILSEVACLPSEAVDPALFSPQSSRSQEDLASEFDAVLESVSDPDYRALLKGFRGDEARFGAFLKAPAATVMHHAWIGGLLEHSLSLCRLSRAVAPNYPGVDLDLLLAACIFHDAGKAEEISPDPGFQYTLTGKLHGHIYMGARLAESLMDGLPGFPEEKRNHLLHLILSHQGDRSEGFGSPVDPSSPEAVLFHQLDNLDAKMQHCLGALERHGGDRPFTDPRANSLRRSYYALRPGHGRESAEPGEGRSPGAPPDRPVPPPSTGGGEEERSQRRLFGGGEEP